ncbi:MAG TPA: Bax inhibitor-1/YccA family protein [Mycobacteriales bacterium]|nr:Bax inhibitor-1/YccA family protein [Mycobacteriales bacterium]
MSSNPVFGSDGRNFKSAANQYASFDAQTPSADQLQDWYNKPAYTSPRYMSLDDVVVRTGVTLGTVVVAAGAAWVLDLDGLAIVGALVGFVLAIIVSIKRSTNPALILSYAACEGLFLGAISHVINARYPGIAIQAVVGTAGVFGGMLVVYKTGAIRVTPKFNRWLMGALFGVVAIMLVNVIASLIVGHDALGIRGGNPGLSIVFSLLCIGIAALSFLSDFDMIDQAIRRGVPEKFAWYAAFGLTVTLVWLYLEILRLLTYLRN